MQVTRGISTRRPRGPWRLSVRLSFSSPYCWRRDCITLERWGDASLSVLVSWLGILSGRCGFPLLFIDGVGILQQENGSKDCLLAVVSCRVLVVLSCPTFSLVTFFLLRRIWGVPVDLRDERFCKEQEKLRLFDGSFRFEFALREGFLFVCGTGFCDRVENLFTALRLFMAYQNAEPIQKKCLTVGLSVERLCGWKSEWEIRYWELPKIKSLLLFGRNFDCFSWEC